MKKLLIVLLTLVLCLTFSGCVTSYIPPNNGDNPGGDNPGGDVPSDDTPFTVSLESDGEPFIPDIPMSAQWYNGESIVSAEFKDGIATTYGLDGTYKVTLSDIPEGYAYDANASEYTATNKRRNVKIKLSKLLYTSGAGTGWYNAAIKMFDTGFYKLTFASAGQSVYCNFSPTESGTYSIESVCDTVANEINPRLNDYGQNRAFVMPIPITCKDGGASSRFTTNFKYSVSIDGDCLNFTVNCDSRIPYPVDVYMKIEFAEGYSRDPVYEMKIPEQIYDSDGEIIPSPAPVGSYIKCGQEAGNANHLLDGSKFALGDDGYYHYKGENGNLTSSIVYVDLTHFLGGRWVTSDDDGLSYYVPTNVKVGKYDYTYFIKGWEGLVEMYGSDKQVPDKYQSLKDGKGYAATALSDNKCAVTSEMREFLKNYCAARQLFFDGLGSAESEGYNSSDEDQWLYYCGYYM